MSRIAHELSPVKSLSLSRVQLGEHVPLAQALILPTLILSRIGSKAPPKPLAGSTLLLQMVSLAVNFHYTLANLFIACPAITGPAIEDWQKSFQADVIGLITLIHAATPHLEQRDGAGSIVVISSLAGFEAKHPAHTGPYAVLKRAQATLAKDFSKVLGPKGIRINSIAPGTINPPSTTRPDGTEELSTFQQIMTANPAFLESLLPNIALGRVGSGQDVANAAVFLGSRLSSYITGTNLIIDGGMSTAL